MTAFQVLDRPIAFHRCFVTLVGNVNAALLLSQAVYWQNRCQHIDGYWWKTMDEWQEETGLTVREQETARRDCAKFLACERRGVPSKNFYRVNLEALDTALRFSPCMTSHAENASLETRKTQDKQRGIRATTVRTETTSETSSEITFPQAPRLVGVENQISSRERPDDPMVFLIRDKLTGVFRRPPALMWPHDEEERLAEIARRPDPMAELAVILSFRKRIRPDRQQKEGVSTCKQILNNWESILDKVNGGYEPNEGGKAPMDVRSEADRVIAQLEKQQARDEERDRERERERQREEQRKSP